MSTLKKPRKKLVRPLYLTPYSNALWRCSKYGYINWTNTQNYLVAHLPAILASGRPILVLATKGHQCEHYRQAVMSNPHCVYPGLEYYKQPPKTDTDVPAHTT